MRTSRAAPALLAILVVLAGCERSPQLASPAPEPASAAASAPGERTDARGAVAASPTATPTSTPSPPETPTATSAPSPTETPTTTPIPTAPPVTAILREAVSLEPGGAVPLTGGTRTVVDPAATFRVELAAPVPDARLLLLDGSDALVAAEGGHEIGASTRLTLAPAAPLVPGSRYTLRLDGAVTRELHATDGRVFAPVAHPLLVAGTPPKPEPKAPAKKKRTRRQM